jgi:hypothetical protein
VGHRPIQRIERADHGKLRDPGVAELGDVRGALPDHGREQLLVRAHEGQRLHAHPELGVTRLEPGDQLSDDLALPACRPELDGRRVRRRSTPHAEVRERDPQPASEQRRVERDDAAQRTSGGHRGVLDHGLPSRLSHAAKTSIASVFLAHPQPR